MIQKTINSIVKSFINNGFISNEDKVYYTNMILGKMSLEYTTDELSKQDDIATLFNEMGNYASKHLNVKKDRFIDEISALLLPAPSVVADEFANTKDKKAAFKKFYNDSINSYYIKYDRLRKNLEWSTKADFGEVDITVNLSKPEKTLEEIKAAKLAKSSSYPKCVLCRENIGFFGNSTRDSRQNIRFVHDKLNGKKVFMHYSPYGYYDEHLIINNYDHVDMKIDNNSIKQLLEFVEKFPFYSIGSNSDIPIVGGSILSHQHYQGGAGNFPVFNSSITNKLKVGSVEVQLLEWPISTIRLVSKTKTDVEKLGAKVLKKWYAYENKSLNIIKSKDGHRQNAVTPFARKNNGKFELYLLLRNNGTSKEAPEGIFHVKEDVWNIKKENIGIIEAAGKAILPGRLLKELDIVADALKDNKKNLPKENSLHESWYQELKTRRPKNKFKEFVRTEVGLKFSKGLTDCGVFYKHDDEFVKFVEKAIK